jgi:hypothetical protein
MSSMFGRKVRVRFVTADGGQPIGEGDFAPEQLPESFEARTTLELGGHSWEVVKAEPMTRAEYAKTRRLTIAMRKIEVAHVSPKDILFSLPTLNDALPAIAPGSSKLGKKVLELHEDDWRQTELVARELSDVVAGELAQIRRILAARTGPGFKELHVRKQPASPLVERHVTLDALMRALPGAHLLDGVAFANVAGVVANGFAIESGDTRAYGLVEDGILTTLALQSPSAIPQPLADLAREHGLLLVRWCRGEVEGF